MKMHNVCWSGGVDSTFIVTQLSQFPVTIRPFYIKGQTFRQSEPQELAAVAAISEILRNDARTKANLLPIEIIEKKDARIKDREIVLAYRRIYKKQLEEYKEKLNGNLPPAGSQQIYADGAFTSPQYLTCASLAKSLGETVELGNLLDDFEHLPPFTYLKTATKPETGGGGRSLLRLIKDENETDYYTLFGRFTYPIAGQKMYKRDVWKWYEDNGYENIRAKTNFCQDPVAHGDGTYEPCGMCTACIGVIREGVLQPFTEAGLARYRDYEENHEKEPQRFRLREFKK